MSLQFFSAFVLFIVLFMFRRFHMSAKLIAIGVHNVVSRYIVVNNC